MEFWRTATNPWGQDVLLGISFDLLWAALIIGIVFVVGHALLVRIGRRGEGHAATAGGDARVTGVPDKVLRHSFAARTFHWLMSVAMIVLLITAFFPVIGIRFPWVTIHWIAGVGLLATIVYHIVHSLVWLDWRTMLFGKKDIRDAIDNISAFLGRGEEPKAGKYPADHKMYHHAVAVVSIVAVVTGVVMMFRVDTPFWTRNPYVLSDGLWGVVYVLHGLSGVGLVTLVIAHVYFAIRPEKWWITMSMIKGWIGREEFLAHHDPERWVVSSDAARITQPTQPTGSAGVPEGAVRGKHSLD